MPDLEPGDFIYQADQELFLVCTENRENEIEFSVHGWRTIDKNRLERYLDKDKPALHTEEQVKEVIQQSEDEDAEEKLQWLKGVFEEYEETEMGDGSSHRSFSMDDT